MKTVIGTYRDMESAVAVVNDLVNAGFERNTISVVAQDPDERYASYVDRDSGGAADDTAKGAGIGAAIGGLGGLLLGLGALAIPGVGPVIAAGPLAAALAGAGVGAVTGGIIGALIDLGVPEESAQLYAESVRRGNVLVAAQVEDNRADEATRIMKRTGLIDIERESEGWRASGWTGFDADRQHMTGTQTGTQTGRTGTRRTEGDETFEVVEEDIQVGKRTVESGGVRVSSQMREVPVEEEVRLREEHVNVERRPVDRPATEADMKAFREGSIEVRETREEPVVAKDARVVEEVHISKDVDEHSETVRDTVRRTDVEVEQLGRTGRTGDGQTSYDIYDSDFRNHWQTNFSRSGSDFNRFQPAYRYGYTLATDDRYRNRQWNDVEPEAHRAWEAQNKGTWDEFKDAIQYSWDRARGRM